MNNRKLIFGIVAGLLIVGLLIFLIIAKVSQKKRVMRVNANGEFNIWIVGDSSQKFEEFLSDFKLDNKRMSNVVFSVVSFPNYKEYSRALSSAIIKGKTPDMFVLNNNEISVFEDKVLPLTNNDIDIHSFRQNYKPIFATDLIVSSGEGEEKQEFLKGIPVGYETLGIFYNKRYRLKPFDFTSISSLKSAIIKVEKLGVTPIAIGNGSTIKDAGDLLAQQFLLNKVKSLREASNAKIKQTLAEYMDYGEGTNNYNELFKNTKYSHRNNIDLFLDKEVAAIVAYPRVILKLQSGGFSHRFLAAAPYPHSFSGDGPSLANYNYFVINQDTKQKTIALDLLKYMNSDLGAEAFFKKFPYYLPARVSLEEKLASKKISNFYDNIVLKDFYSDEPLSSFDKGNKVYYDEKIIDVLDSFNSFLSSFEKFKNSTLCITDKVLKLEKLSAKCE